MMRTLNIFVLRLDMISKIHVCGCLKIAVTICTTADVLVRFIFTILLLLVITTSSVRG